MKKIIISTLILVSTIFASQNDGFSDPILKSGCKAYLKDKNSLNNNVEVALTYYYIKGLIVTTPLIYKGYNITKAPNMEEICAFSIEVGKPVITSVIYLTGKINNVPDKVIENVYKLDEKENKK